MLSSLVVFEFIWIWTRVLMMYHHSLFSLYIFFVFKWPPLPSSSLYLQMAFPIFLNLVKFSYNSLESGINFGAWSLIGY